MEEYTLDVIKECPYYTPHGPYPKLKDKYGLTWEEYVVIWRYSCLVGRVNNDLLKHNKKIRQFTDFLSKALDKLNEKDYPSLFAAISFRPPLDWKIETIRSTSFETSTPLLFMKEENAFMTVFENVTDLPEITEISLYRDQYEVIIPPSNRGKSVSFSAYDVDYLPGNNHIVYYQPKKLSKSSNYSKSFQSEVYTKDFYKLQKPVSVKVNWKPCNAIDIFGNNILHYMVGIMSNVGIWKYKELLNTPNDAGITPAMKLLKTGQYWIFMEYSDMIDFGLKDSSGRGMMHHISSMIIPYKDEKGSLMSCLKEINFNYPKSIDEIDIFGYNPLHYCNFTDLFILIESFSRKNILDEKILDKIFVSRTLDGYTPHQGKRMFEILKKYGNIPNNTGVYFSKSIDRLKLLKKNNMLDIKTEDGDTLFHTHLNNFKMYVDFKNCEEILNFLIKNFTVNVTNSYGETPLMLYLSGLRSKPRRIIDKLFENKLNFHQKNVYGDTQSAYVINYDDV